MYLTFWVKSAVQRVIKQKILQTITKACKVMLDVFGIIVIKENTTFHRKLCKSIVFRILVQYSMSIIGSECLSQYCGLHH